MLMISGLHILDGIIGSLETLGPSCFTPGNALIAGSTTGRGNKKADVSFRLLLLLSSIVQLCQLDSTSAILLSAFPRTTRAFP